MYDCSAQSSAAPAAACTSSRRCLYSPFTHTRIHENKTRRASSYCIASTVELSIGERNSTRPHERTSESRCAGRCCACTRVCGVGVVCECERGGGGGCSATRDTVAGQPRFARTPRGSTTHAQLSPVIKVSYSCSLDLLLSGSVVSGTGDNCDLSVTCGGVDLGRVSTAPRPVRGGGVVRRSLDEVTVEEGGVWKGMDECE
jgi:hypothetical protein